MSIIQQLGQSYFHVFSSHEFTGCMDQHINNLSLEQAYQVQNEAAELKIKAGNPRAGWKVGCTSPAIQNQLQLNEPINAPMYKTQIFEQGPVVSRSNYLNLAIEPELVISLNTDVPVPPKDHRELVDAIDWVAAGIELHNKQFFFNPISSQELIASGGLWAGLIIGPDRLSPKGLDLDAASFKVYFDDKLEAQAPGKDIMGGPLTSLDWLSKCLAEKGCILKKGDLVIPGSPTEVFDITKATLLSVEITGVGCVETRFS